MGEPMPPMPTLFLSDQERARTGVGGGLPRKLRATEAGGRLSCVLFRCVLPASGDFAIGDQIALGALPAGVAVLSAVAAWDRPQAGRTCLGIAGAPTKYGIGFAERFVEHYIPPPVVESEQRILATNVTAPWTAGATLWVRFVFCGA